MSIPPNQFRRDHPWTRFVLLDSSAGPVPSQAKVTHSLTLSLKKRKNKSNTCRSTETSTDDVLLCLAGRVDKLVECGCISIGRSVYTPISVYRSVCKLISQWICNHNQPICQPALLSKAIRRRLKSQCFCMCWICFFFFLRITLMSGLLLLVTGRALLMSPKGRNASRDGLV